MADFTTVARSGRVLALAAVTGKAITDRPKDVGGPPCLGDRASDQRGVYRLVPARIAQLLSGR